LPPELAPTLSPTEQLSRLQVLVAVVDRRGHGDGGGGSGGDGGRDAPALAGRGVGGGGRAGGGVAGEDAGRGGGLAVLEHLGALDGRRGSRVVVDGDGGGAGVARLAGYKFGPADSFITYTGAGVTVVSMKDEQSALWAETEASPSRVPVTARLQLLPAHSRFSMMLARATETRDRMVNAFMLAGLFDDDGLRRAGDGGRGLEE